MIRKWLAIGIILLFIGVAIAPAIAQNAEKSQSTSRGNWLYVGGSGPGNYTKIQDAIDDAADGDIIYVYNGTYASVVINKYISLRGENKSTTIIDGAGAKIPVTIAGSDNYSFCWLNVSGFTIRNSGYYEEGIWITNMDDPITNVNIYDNIITQNNDGIRNINGVDCHIFNNIITENRYRGLELGDSKQRTYATNNIITNNLVGIYTASEKLSTIQMNQIEGNEVGIRLCVENRATITKNNFIDNVLDVDITGTFSPLGYVLWILFFGRLIKSKWYGNYWDKWNTNLPKPIIGLIEVELVIPRSGDNYIYIPLGFYPSNLRFDWFPAQEPYDIPGMS